MTCSTLSLFADTNVDWSADHSSRIDDVAMAYRAKEFVPGLDYIPDYIERGEEHALLRLIDSGNWDNHWQRRTQHYGRSYRESLRPTYDLRSLTDSFETELPRWTAPLCRRLVADGIFGRPPNQMGINEYVPGQGIAPHVDYHGGDVVSITLGSGCLMDFSHNDGPTLVSTWLAPRSIVVLKGEARTYWRHGIARRKSDVVDGYVLPRTRRVSITFRYIP